VPSHVTLEAVVVLHALPHPAQFDVVFVGVSQPFVSGAVLSQSAKNPTHPVYEHFVPSHVAPLLCVVSQTLPHPPHDDVDDDDDSHPSVSGGAVLQSRKPDEHPP
jgi:hypothetical protein